MEDFDVSVEDDDRAPSFASFGHDVDEGLLAYTTNEEPQMKKKQPKWGAYRTMGLNYDLLRGILRKGYINPTPIQRKAIPAIISGKDVVGMARTGSGKTAAFLVPLFEKLKFHSVKVGARALILAPTRELALQTIKFIHELGKFKDLRTTLIVGGDSMDEQFSSLAANPDILVGTPGRVLHIVKEANINLKSIEYLVLDEADRLFEMGLAEQVREILKMTPPIRQTVMFSATLPSMMLEFAKNDLHDPVMIRLDTEKFLSPSLNGAFFTLHKEDKVAMLFYILRKIIPSAQKTIIFVPTRHHVEFLAELLKSCSFQVSSIFGTMDQVARKANVETFRAGYSTILIVTDLAARGIDIPMLDNVINFDFPARSKLFVHRAGRAGRMGRPGTVYTLIGPDELSYFIDLMLFLGMKAQDEIPADAADFDPMNFYYGSVFQEIVDTEKDWLKEKLESIEMQQLVRTTENAMKLYNKTRPSPSPESVSRAKELTEIKPHPLILKLTDRAEKDKFDFVLNMKRYRPNQTVFEFESSKSSGAKETKPAADVMRIKRQKDDAIIQKAKMKKVEAEQEIEDETIEETPVQAPEEPKTFGSILKKQMEKLSVTAEIPAKKYADENFFMGYTNKASTQEKGLEIHENPEDLVLEMAGDDRDTMNAKKKSLVWDRKRKKFVTAGKETSQMGKKIKTESGKTLFEKDANRGKLYEQWKQKSKLYIPSTGISEDNEISKRAADNLRSKPWKLWNKGKEPAPSLGRGDTRGPPREEQEGPQGGRKGEGVGKSGLRKSTLKSKDQLVREKKVENRKKAFQNKKNGGMGGDVRGLDRLGFGGKKGGGKGGKGGGKGGAPGGGKKKFVNKRR